MANYCFTFNISDDEFPSYEVAKDETIRLLREAADCLERGYQINGLLLSDRPTNIIVGSWSHNGLSISWKNDE